MGFESEQRIVGDVTGEWAMAKHTGSAERPSHDQVARLAYQFYEQRGREEGHELEDWLDAEQELARHLRAAALPFSSSERRRRELAGPVPSQHAFAARRAKFRELHEGPCFVIPNQWDVGSARYLERAGFPALSTTSGEAVPLERMLEHVSEIVNAVHVPVTADFAPGYGATPDEVEQSVARCVATGVAGLSIEDRTGDPKEPHYEISIAVERVKAARRAIDRSGGGVVLTASAECFRLGHPNAYLESIRRLQAYAEAGADVLFAPGVRSPNEIRALVASVSPKPFHLLVSGNLGLGVQEIAALGVRRISVGCALGLAAWAGLMRSSGARAVSDAGT